MNHVNVKSNIILCAALSLSGSFDFVQADDISGKSSTDTGQSFDSLVIAAFPGKSANNYRSISVEREFRKLTLAQCNQIAVSAARELSLRTTNSYVITKEIVDELSRKPATQHTPAEAELLRLHENNDGKVSLLRDLSNAQLINDPGVIGPLINMLGYPGEKTSIRSEAAQVLCQLTGRSRQESGQLYQFVDGENNPKRPHYVAWWRDWWAKNKNKHPVFDNDVKNAIVARVSAIQKQLCLGVKGYADLGDLHPTWVQINNVEPALVANVDIDSSVGSRPRTEKYEILLRIRAQFETPPFLTNRTDAFKESKKWWEGKVENVYREELPGTDIVITVEAASTDGAFAKRVRECMAKHSQSVESEIPLLIQQLETEKDSAQAASLLVRVGEYSPVIAALTNSNLTIQRNAVMALATFNYHAADGTSIKGAVLPLIHLLKTSDAYTRYLASWALGHVHQEDKLTVAALIAAMDDEDEQAGTSAMVWLREFKSQEDVIVPAMIKKLSDTNATVRTQATRTLGELSRCRDKELAKTIVAALIKSLEDTDNHVRCGALWALGCNGKDARDAVPELLKLTDSDDKDLRRQARAAIMQIDFETAKKAGLVN